MPILGGHEPIHGEIIKPTGKKDEAVCERKI